MSQRAIAYFLLGLLIYFFLSDSPSLGARELHIYLILSYIGIIKSVKTCEIYLLTLSICSNGTFVHESLDISARICKGVDSFQCSLTDICAGQNISISRSMVAYGAHIVLGL